MARSLTVFECTACGFQSPKWLGRCPECGSWSTLEESRPEKAASRSSIPASAPVPYPDIPRTDAARLSTGIPELDRVLGGGLVQGAAILLGGEPGIGKSTLLLQAASLLSGKNHHVLYVTGEESATQLRLRGDRLKVTEQTLLVLEETDVDRIVATARENSPALLVVDSIQAVSCSDVSSVPGSVGQVRESATRLVRLAKSTGLPVILVGHVTKEGGLAGPRALEHVVDTVVQFEGDRHHAHRILRTLKNRFGPSDEIGVFRMTSEGLQEVPNPSEVFLAERPENVPGSAVHAAIEGTRPVLVEIQALVGEPMQGNPRRTALGIDSQRLALILAVLQRRAGLTLSDRDVFVNVAGGLTLTEPASDLAVAAAVASSYNRKPIPHDWALIGELGLAGELRSVSRIDARIKEAERLGFNRTLVPGKATKHLLQALEELFG